jgi:hypothetical protein
MKSLLLLFLSFFFFTSHAQTIDTSWCGPSDTHAYIDSTFLFCDSNTVINFHVENTPNNLWQFGKTTKFGTSEYRDSLCGIVTDTLNAYSTNNQSAFNLIFPERNPGNGFYYYNYYIKFWHKFDTDSLLDGCWLEFSDDTGATYHRIDSITGWNNYFANGFNACNLYTNNINSTNQAFDTLLNGQKAWSGNSNGWRHTSIWFNMALPIKPARMNLINAIRFVFQSDSIQTNKAGWIIDELNIGYAIGPGAIESVTQYNQLPIYPNPSSSGLFSISFPSNYIKGDIDVYDIHGRKILHQALTKSIDLSNQIQGIYYYKIQLDGNLYSGVLEKN